MRLFEELSRPAPTDVLLARRLGDLLAIDAERLRHWTFARLAVESSRRKAAAEAAALARALSG